MPRRKHVDVRWERTRPLLFPGAVVALKIGERSYAREGSYRVARSATAECPCDGGDMELDDSSLCVIDVRVRCTTCPSIFCCKHVSAARLSALKDGVERLWRYAAIPRHSRATTFRSAVSSPIAACKRSLTPRPRRSAS